MLRIETLAIGDEILTGRIADTNSAFVASQLFQRGLRLERVTVIADEASAIRQAIGVCSRRADFVVCFGGLGPTSDDKTAAVVSDLLGTELIQDPNSLERLRDFLKRRNRVETPQVLKQVVFPKGCDVVPNGVGLAPGFSMRVGQCRFFFLPGVPMEMKPMFCDAVLPAVVSSQAERGGESLWAHTWKCVGIPESELQRRMDGVERTLPSAAYLGYRTRFPENYLTLYWKGSGSKPDRFYEIVSAISQIIEEWTYTQEEKELEQIVWDRLKASGQTLAFAESCTGGLCAERMTKVPGSSEVFWGGAVVYQVDAKEKLLGVKLENHLDAVSQECSRKLAQNLKSKSGVSIAVAITGYMGPSGGTQADPVGTFYVCVAGDSIVERRIFLPGFTREATQWAASCYALNEIRKILEGK